MSLEVEPTFLAHVASTTWHDADMEMRKIAHRASVEVTHTEISRQQAVALSVCVVQKSVRAPSLPV